MQSARFYFINVFCIYPSQLNHLREKSINSPRFSFLYARSKKEGVLKDISPMPWLHPCGKFLKRRSKEVCNYLFKTLTRAYHIPWPHYLLFPFLENNTRLAAVAILLCGRLNHWLWKQTFLQDSSSWLSLSRYQRDTENKGNLTFTNVHMPCIRR